MGNTVLEAAFGRYFADTRKKPAGHPGEHPTPAGGERRPQQAVEEMHHPIRVGGSG